MRMRLLVGGLWFSVGVAVLSADPPPVAKEMAPASNEESSWSPDGKEMAFDSNRADGKNYNAYVLNVAANVIRRLTTSAANDITPAWSPDGRMLAFTSDRTGHNEIYVMKADGSDIRQVTHDGSDDIHPG